MGNFVLFLVALLLWAVSLFLVAEAAKTQKWALGRDSVPDPYSGVGMSQVLSFVFIFLWATRVFITSQSTDPLRFASQLLLKPDQLTGGIVLAVFPPIVVGLVKVITALVVSRGEETELERRNRFSVTSFYLVLHLLIGIVAAVLLYRFFL